MIRSERLTEIGKEFSLSHYSSVSTAVERIRRRRVAGSSGRCMEKYGMNCKGKSIKDLAPFQHLPFPSGHIGVIVIVTNHLLSIIRHM